jgi:oxygen-independent coproporphyrinogen-3 oxidase
MSACGYAGGVRYRNARGFDEYCAAIEAGRRPRAEEERLDAAGRLGEAAMLALRTSDGIRDDDFRARFGVDARAVFARPIKECREAGLLEETREGVRLTARGRLLANAACMEFLHPNLMPASA